MSASSSGSADGDSCGPCGASSDEARLGFSEARNEPVCMDCVSFLAEHGHYPDEDGPERDVTLEYAVREEGA